MELENKQLKKLDWKVEENWWKWAQTGCWDKRKIWSVGLSVKDSWEGIEVSIGLGNMAVVGDLW